MAKFFIYSFWLMISIFPTGEMLVTDQHSVTKSKIKAFNELLVRQDGKQLSQYVAFYNHFQLVDTLFFNYANLVIGDISKLVVLDNDTKLAIYDGIANSVIWVDLKSKKHKTLSVEDVIPGHKLDVLAICKDPNKGFWLASVPNYFFKFDDEGKLINHFVIDQHYLSFRFCIGYDSNIIAYMDDRWPNSVIQYNTKNKKANKLFELNSSPNLKNANQRMNSGGGILIDNDQKLYFSNTIENRIYRYNFGGEVLNIFKSNNKNFTVIETDFPENKVGVMEFLAQKPTFSSVLSMYFLNPESIIALYAVNNRPNIEIFSKRDGKVLNKAEILLPLHMAYAENGLIYLIYHPEEELKTNSYGANPMIIRYKFKS